MSDAVTVALIAAVASNVMSFINHRKIVLVHKETNSMKDALVKAEKAKSFSEGQESERAKK